jgi:hypothetical protein
MGLAVGLAAWAPTGSSPETGTNSGVRLHGAAHDPLAGILPGGSASFLGDWLTPSTSSAAASLERTANRDGLTFTENRGQLRDAHGSPRTDILFVARDEGASIFITDRGISYVFSGRNGAAHRMDMRLIGANPNPRVIAEEPAPGVSNYYHGRGECGVSGVRSYGKVVLAGVYDRIDLVIYGREGGMKYDFVVHPGGDPSDIRFSYDGAARVRTGSAGSLQVQTPVGQIVEQAPFTYQEGTLGRSTVESSYRIDGGTVGFAVGSHDATRPLVVDPTVSWATFYGGSGDDQFLDCAVDATGQLFATGWTTSVDFPTGPGAWMGSFAGESDAVIAKFSASGERLWATYFGGASGDEGHGITVANDGSIYVIGQTSSNEASFPVTSRALQQSYGGNDDIFVARFSNSGELDWASYRGGTDMSHGVAIAVRGDRICFTGYTSNIGFPTTNPGNGAYVQTQSGGDRDIVLACWNLEGTTEYWSTLYGGGAEDYPTAVQVDASGNLYVIGYTQTLRGNNVVPFPMLTSPAPAQPQSAGGHDAFLLKFNSEFVRINTTYLGGADNDRAYDCVLDGAGRLFVCGETNSSDFPGVSRLAPGRGQPTNGGGTDAFLAVYNAQTCELLRSTYFGGEGPDVAHSLNVLSASTFAGGQPTVLIAGNSRSTNMPVSPSGNQLGSTALPVQTSRSGGTDGFMACFTVDGARLFSSYYGGKANDYITGACIYRGPISDIFMFVGYTIATDFPTVDPLDSRVYFQPNSGGVTDGVIVKMAFGAGETVLGIKSNWSLVDPSVIAPILEPLGDRTFLPVVGSPVLFEESVLRPDDSHDGRRAPTFVGNLE